MVFKWTCSHLIFNLTRFDPKTLSKRKTILIIMPKICIKKEKGFLKIKITHFNTFNFKSNVNTFKFQTKVLICVFSHVKMCLNSNVLFDIKEVLSSNLHLPTFIQYETFNV